MGDRETYPLANDAVRDAVQAFDDLHPYPPPVEDLDSYGRRWQDENRRRADLHLYWPDQAYRADLKVLVAGCGTSQAAKHALRQPAAQVVGIDFSQTSVRHTQALKRSYHLTNLEVVQLPVERVGELGVRSDKIVCTGVLHHLPDPEQGLHPLCTTLQPTCPTPITAIDLRARFHSFRRAVSRRATTTCSATALALLPAALVK